MMHSKRLRLVVDSEPQQQRVLLFWKVMIAFFCASGGLAAALIFLLFFSAVPTRLDQEYVRRGIHVASILLVLSSSMTGFMWVRCWRISKVYPLQPSAKEREHYSANLADTSLLVALALTVPLLPVVMVSAGDTSQQGGRPIATGIMLILLMSIVVCFMAAVIAVIIWTRTDKMDWDG